MERAASAYLFKLFHVNVQLTAKFGFRIRESRYLIRQSPASTCFCFGPFALDLVLGLKMCYFRIFVAEDGFEL